MAHFSATWSASDRPVSSYNSGTEAWIAGGDTSGTDTIAGAGGISPKESAGQRGEMMSGWKGYNCQDCIGIDNTDHVTGI